jgi:hypothetical protein
MRTIRKTLVRWLSRGVAGARAHAELWQSDYATAGSRLLAGWTFDRSRPGHRHELAEHPDITQARAALLEPNRCRSVGFLTAVSPSAVRITKATFSSRGCLPLEAPGTALPTAGGFFLRKCLEFKKRPSEGANGRRPVTSECGV